MQILGSSTTLVVHPIREFLVLAGLLLASRLHAETITFDGSPAGDSKPKGMANGFGLTSFAAIHIPAFERRCQTKSRMSSRPRLHGAARPLAEQIVVSHTLLGSWYTPASRLKSRLKPNTSWRQPLWNVTRPVPNSP